jgi:roadblock/LC7 domain-containing protein
MNPVDPLMTLDKAIVHQAHNDDGSVVYVQYQYSHFKIGYIANLMISANGYMVSTEDRLYEAVTWAALEPAELFIRAIAEDRKILSASS